MNKGRFREFYQADFDIIGETNETMINEYLLFKHIIVGNILIRILNNQKNVIYKLEKRI